MSVNKAIKEGLVIGAELDCYKLYNLACKQNQFPNCQQ